MTDFKSTINFQDIGSPITWLSDSDLSPIEPRALWFSGKLLAA